MSEQINEVNPDNPRCPICGAVDWYSHPGHDYVLHTVYKGANQAILGDEGAPMVIPFEGFICRVCRFIRLRSAAGTLDPADIKWKPPDTQ